MKKYFMRAKSWLAGLSFKTGLWVLAACVVCYALSFAQTLLPISLAMKGTLWVVFFGMAKALQYSGILILGKEGVKRLKRILNRKTVDTA